MAAEAAVSSAVQILGNLLVQKVNFLRGVEGDVQWLKDEFKRIQCFLKDAGKKRTQNESVRNWISEIREVAHDAQDAIEIYILNVENSRSSRGLLERFACFPSEVHHLNKVGHEIQSLRKRLQDIEISRQRYGIQDLGEGMNSSRRSSENVERRRRLAYWEQDKDVVGLDKDVKLLLQNAILDGRGGLSIATIVGMGGIGKSTLARKIYSHVAGAAEFECHAWVVVSSEFMPEETIKQVMLQLKKSEKGREKVLKEIRELEESMKDKLFLQEKLKEMLHTQLEGKAYFIVLDDVWEHTHWEYLRSAFPNQQDKASRLLVTSRNKVVIKHAQYVHEMKLLDSDNSWDLLLKKAFIDNTNGKCPEELEYIGRKILEKCHGLPLTISVVGGLLMEQPKSKSGWENVLKGIDSSLGRGESSVPAILELSYQNLPPQLKSCFLCLGLFKENAIIHAEKLVQVWIALDLVLQDEIGGEETMEDIGRGYLYELINRNMIQVKDITTKDRVKTCHIHDLLRELSIRKAQEDIKLEILREEGSSQSTHKPRHCAMYCSEGRFIYSTNQNKHLRSLFVHGLVFHRSSSSYWKSFELLRVLDLEDSELEKLPDSIGGLIGLRYLSLRNTRISKLPRWLGKLENLHFLDLRSSSVEKLPNFIWKIKSLRHLYAMGIWLKLPVEINTLKNFQALGNVVLTDSAIELLTQMTSLRKLGIDLHKIQDSSNVSKLFTSLAMMDHLVRLSLIHCYSLNMEGLGSLHRITQLKLKRVTTRLPSANNFPPNLSYLTLSRTSLEEDPMPVLEKLPNLMYLKLRYDTSKGKKMVISHEGFPRLKRLYLKGLICNIEVEEGAMPDLQRWEIYNCPNLKVDNLPDHVKSAINYYKVRKLLCSALLHFSLI